MTLPAFAEGFGSRLPHASDKDAANQLRMLLAAQASGEAKLRVVSDQKEVTDVILTPGLSGLLMELLRHVGRGDAVTLMPVSQMLTTQQAADLLNVSRPFLVSLLDSGKIPHVLVGRHRRIQADDLFAYKTSRAGRRGRALSDLAALDGEML